MSLAPISWGSAAALKFVFKSVFKKNASHMAPPPGRMPAEISKDPQGPLEISANILSKGSPGKDPCHIWRLLLRPLIHITTKTKLDLGDDAFRAGDLKATIYSTALTQLTLRMTFVIDAH